MSLLVMNKTWKPVNKQRKEIIREAKAEAQRILAEANAKDREYRP